MKLMLFPRERATLSTSEIDMQWYEMNVILIENQIFSYFLCLSMTWTFPHYCSGEGADGKRVRHCLFLYDLTVMKIFDVQNWILMDCVCKFLMMINMFSILVFFILNLSALLRTLVAFFQFIRYHQSFGNNFLVRDRDDLF